MADAQTAVFDAVRSLLDSTDKKGRSFDADTPLYAEGLGLTSLEAAELSVLLEDTFGTDPYTEGVVPETVGQIVAFYEERQPAT